jgi:hypothetical protein
MTTATRQSRKMPAATIVAAWISADTGVGPSIASGSQTCNGIWPDLPTAPQKRSSPIEVATMVGEAAMLAEMSASVIEPNAQ